MRLGEILVAQGLLTPAQRDEILAAQEECGRPFGLLAETMFHVSPQAVEQAWVIQHASRAQQIDPASVLVNPALLQVVTRRQAWQFGVLPVGVDRNPFGDAELVLATARAFLARAMRFAGWRIQGHFRFVLCCEDALAEALHRAYPLTPSDERDGGLARA